MQECYQRAQSLLQGFKNQHLVRNFDIQAHWIDGVDCFWYQRQHDQGTEYRLVDAGEQSNHPAFNHKALADALAIAVENIPVSKGEVTPTIDSHHLPIEAISMNLSPLTLSFTAFVTWLLRSPVAKS